MTDEKVWIIQRCINAMDNRYESWPGYDAPMARDVMMRSLTECEELWPDYEFRGHRINQEQR